MLSILCLRLTIKVKVGIPESLNVGWYPPKKTGSSHLKLPLPAKCFSYCLGSQGKTLACLYFCNRLRTAKPNVTLLLSNHDRSNHDRRIMSENPGIYIAMTSAVIAIKEGKLDGTFIHAGL